MQIRRPLQIESLGSSLLLAAHHLGLYDVQVVSTYGSQNLAGGAAKALAALTTLAGAAAIVAVWLALARGPLDPRRVLAASAAVVAAFVAFDKVLSPQFLIWLVPLVPLVAGRTGAVAGALLLAALGLTQGWFPSRYRELVALGDVSWLVLARDLVLVALYGVLAAAVAASSASRSERT